MCLPVKDRGRGVDLTGQGSADVPALSSGLQDLQVKQKTASGMLMHLPPACMLTLQGDQCRGRRLRRSVALPVFTDHL